MLKNVLPPRFLYRIQIFLMIQYSTYFLQSGFRTVFRKINNILSIRKNGMLAVCNRRHDKRLTAHGLKHALQRRIRLFRKNMHGAHQQHISICLKIKPSEKKQS